MEFKDRIVLQSHRSGFKNLVLLPEPWNRHPLPEAFLLFLPNLLLTESGWKQLKALEPASDTLTMISETDSLALVRCKDAKFVSEALSGIRVPTIDLLASLGTRLKRESSLQRARVDHVSERGGLSGC